MTKLRHTTNHASSLPQNTVQRPQSNLRESTVERRAIIQSISYEGMCQSRSGRGGKRAGNNPEFAEVVIAGSSQCSYVLSKRQFLVQDDPKVPDRRGEQKGRDFSRQGLRVQPVQLLAGAQPNILSFMRICSKRLDDIQGIESIGGLGHSSDCRSCLRC